MNCTTCEKIDSCKRSFRLLPTGGCKGHKMSNNIPEELKIFKGLPCDIDPNVTQEDMQKAILDHCRAGKEQMDVLSNIATEGNKKEN